MLESCRRGTPCALAVALSVSFACKEEEMRPGPAQDCNDPACLEARGDSTPLPLPMGPGNGGAAGGGAMPEGDAEISGTVLEIVSQDLVSTQSLRGEVEVRAENPSGGDPLVVQPSADGGYRLEGIERAAGIWVGVGNFRDPPIEPFIDTLQAVDSGRSGFTNLVVLHRDTIEALAAVSFLNQPVVLAAAGAHLLVQFVDGERRPVAGVQITFPAPENVSTAYDAGDAYSDAVPETSTRGMAILLNLDAPPWPGSALSIVADRDGDQLSATVRLARGAISVVTAVVPDP